MDDPERAAAWEAVHTALEGLPDWKAMPPSYNADERLWRASAFCVGHVHIFERRPSLQVRGMTEAEALRELAEALRARAGRRGLTTDRLDADEPPSLPHRGQR
ncbi:MAG: hypothetical protein ACLQBX_01490 [Candidatus Limnocylindrales bacterium]